MDKYKIYLDGVLVPSNEYNGIDNMTIVINTSNMEQSIDMPNEITFRGNSRKIILDKLLITTATPNNNTVIVDIEVFILGAYKHIYRGEISDSYKFCNNECAISCKMLDKSITSINLDCVNSMLVTQREHNGRTSLGEDEGVGSVLLGYYDESRPKMWTMFLVIIMMVVISLVTVTLRVAQILTLGLVDMSGASNKIIELFIKPRYHKAVFFLTFFQNICKLCDLKLNAPLFTSDKLGNLARLDAQIQEGSEDRDFAKATAIYREFNSPNITFSEFMQPLEDFNLHYRVVGDTLHIGKYSEVFTGVWIDFTQRDTITAICFDHTEEVLPAIGYYSYTADALDGVGNEALIEGVYKQIAEYNITGRNTGYKGANRKNFQFAPARVVGDGLESIIEWIGNSGYLSLLPNNARNKRAFNGSLLMQRGITGLPKIVAIDKNTPKDNAKIEKSNVIHSRSGYYVESAPMYNARAFLGFATRQRAQEDGFYTERIYDLNYHLGALLLEDNPNYRIARNRLENGTVRQRFSFSVTFALSCEDIDDINSGNIGYRVLLPYEDTGIILEGAIETISIDLEKEEITITGKTI